MTKPGVMRWSAPLAGPAAAGGSGSGQRLGANLAANDLCRQTRRVIRDG
jgi:hypothetical protein